MTGKEKCKLLRQIRSEIAQANGIAYSTGECSYQGDDCPGTCPKCDAEVRQLESELNRKEARGENISLKGLCELSNENGRTNTVKGNPDSGLGRSLSDTLRIDTTSKPPVPGVIAEQLIPDDDELTDRLLPSRNYWDREMGIIEEIEPDDKTPESHVHSAFTPPDFRMPVLNGYVQDCHSFEKDAASSSRDEIIHSMIAEVGSYYREEYWGAADLTCADIESLCLPPYICNTLRSAGIQTINDLIRLTEAEVIRIFPDRGSAMDLIRTVKSLGFTFSEGWSSGHLMGVLR